MSKEYEALINSLLLVATADSEIDEHMKRFLAEGGRSVLFGESREEYVARSMSSERIARESASSMRLAIEQARTIAGPVLVAVDQEIGGIQRLGHLLPEQPSLPQLLAMSDDELLNTFTASALLAKAMGVNVFLAPIVDTLKGPNPWLTGRTVSADVVQVSRLSKCFVQAAEAVEVMAVVKHFPGHAHVPFDPAVDNAAQVLGDGALLEQGYPAFEACVAASAGGVMLGPAPVLAIDASCAASCSAPVVKLLRGRFGFEGLAVSDGLEAAATSAGRPLIEVALQSLSAGAELLLLGSGEHLPQLTRDIALAVERGELEKSRLVEAACKVDNAILRYAA